MKKKASLAALILQAVAAVALFLPWVYSQAYWRQTTQFPYGFTKRYTYAISFFGGVQGSGGALSYLALAVMILAIVVLALVLAGRSGPITQMGIYASPLALVLAAAAALIRILNRSYEGGDTINDPSTTAFWEISPGWLFYIIAALQIAAAVLCILIALNKFRDDAPQSARRSAPAASASELKELKALLDAGVITQEEFSAKKKDLLGI